MAVAFDAQSTSDTAANGVTTVNHTGLTVGSGSNRALVVLVVWGTGQPSSISVTWDSGGSNQACSLISGASNLSAGKSAQLWGLLNPVSGNKTLNVSWTTSSDVMVAACSFTGAGSFANGTSATGSSTTSSVTVTSTTNDYVVAAHVNDTNNITAVNNTQVFRDTANGNSETGAGNRAVGAATVTMTGTNSASATWTAVGASVVASASAAAAPTPLTKTLFWPRRLLDARLIHPTVLPGRLPQSVPTPTPKPRPLIWPLRAKLYPMLPKQRPRPLLPWQRFGKSGKPPLETVLLRPAPNAPVPQADRRQTRTLIWPLRAKLMFPFRPPVIRLPLPTLPWARLAKGKKPPIVFPTIVPPPISSFAVSAVIDASALGMTASVGSVTVVGNAVVGITETGITASVGSATVSIATTVPVTETGMTMSVGTPLLPVTGQVLTISVGSVTVIGKANVDVSGQSVSAFVGNAVFAQPVTVNLSGTQMTAYAGQLGGTAGGAVWFGIGGQQMTARTGQVNVGLIFDIFGGPSRIFGGVVR